MKNVRIIIGALIIGLLVGVLTSFEYSSGNSKEYAMMRVYELSNLTGDNHSQIIITYEDGRSETIKIPSYSIGSEPGDTNFSEINQQLVKVLNEVGSKGYKVISTVNSSYGEFLNIIIVLEKIE